jgi:hypothetical protein
LPNLCRHLSDIVWAGHYISARHGAHSAPHFVASPSCARIWWRHRLFAAAAKKAARKAKMAAFKATLGDIAITSAAATPADSEPAPPPLPALPAVSADHTCGSRAGTRVLPTPSSHALHWPWFEFGFLDSAAPTFADLLPSSRRLGWYPCSTWRPFTAPDLRLPSQW